MAFKGITIEKFIKLQIKDDSSVNKAQLEQTLNRALKDYQNGVKCHCGNDIWVIGSAFFGNSCFTCITGESTPTDDYEIDSAILKRENTNDQRHIDDIKPHEIHGFFSDDGHEINMDLIKKPTLCLTCIHNDDPNEEMLCKMNRHDQRNDQEFKCFAFKKLDF